MVNFKSQARAYANEHVGKAWQYIHHHTPNILFRATVLELMDHKAYADMEDFLDGDTGHYKEAEREFLDVYLNYAKDRIFGQRLYRHS